MNKQQLARYGSLDQICATTRSTCSEGVARGNDIISVSIGRLSYVVNVDRGLDILDLQFCGVGICYKSIMGNVSPHLANTSAYSFGRHFSGGMLYTCGLDNIGGGENVHGCLSLTPATNVQIYKQWVDSQLQLTISGDITYKILFGVHLVVHRSIRSTLGTDKVEVIDTLENLGYVDAPYYLLYHYNFGYPFICEGVKISGEWTSTTPRNERAREGLAQSNECTAPIDNWQEQVFYRTQQMGKVIINGSNNIQCTLEYDNSVLPHLLQWKSMASGDYALGLEPSTSLLDDDKCTQILPVNTSKQFVTSLTFSIK